MDLRIYYKKLRETESELSGPFIVIVSLATPDGGKAGIMTEVARLTAATHIVEGRARAATAEETEAFHWRNEEAKEAAEQAAAMNKMQFVVVPAKGGSKASKE